MCAYGLIPCCKGKAAKFLFSPGDLAAELNGCYPYALAYDYDIQCVVFKMQYGIPWLAVDIYDFLEFFFHFISPQDREIYKARFEFDLEEACWKSNYELSQSKLID